MTADTAPWLSVVTVVRNDEVGFTATAESMAQQNLTGVEYIVIDSSDSREEVPAVLRRLPELDAQYQWLPAQGIYPAMNAGLDNARGTYILFANSGDHFHEHSTLERLHEILDRESPLWLVGRVCVVDELGTEAMTGKLDFHRERAHHFARGVFPPHQATVVRTQTLRELQGFSTEYVISADYHAALRLGEISIPLVTDQVIMSFHEGGTSTHAWQESFMEFHRARRNVYSLRGWAGIRERWNTLWHFGKVWVYKQLVQRMGK